MKNRNFEEDLSLTEKSPPGWTGTVKAMKKHMPDKKAFALAWSMYKKGAKPHYKATSSSTSDETPVLKKKYQEGIAGQLEAAMSEERNFLDAPVPANAVKEIQKILKGGRAVDKDALAHMIHKITWKKKDSQGKRLGITAGGVGMVIKELEKQGKVSIDDDKVKLEGVDNGLDDVFQETVELSEAGKHYYDGKDYYVDTAFINAIGDTMPKMALDSFGFGEFSLKGNGNSIEFDRMRGKKFKGQSGRSHKIYDNKGGKLVKELIRSMEAKNRSELVRENVDVVDRIDCLVEKRKGPPSQPPLDPSELRSDNPELVSVLMRSTEQTRRFIRAIYHVEEVAADLVEAAKETERLRRTEGLEYAMRRSNLGNVARAFDAETKKIYGHFAEGRNAMNQLAKMAKISTRRTGKRKAPSKATKEITATNLVRDVLQITSRMGAIIREAAEMGSVTIREGEKLLNRKSVISGEKLQDRLTAYVQAYLDFRDLVSSGLYNTIRGVVRRLNEMGERLMKMNEGVEWPMLSLPWEEDPDFENIWEDSGDIVFMDDIDYSLGTTSQARGWLQAVS